jgi:hypothetical protein
MIRIWKVLLLVSVCGMLAGVVDANAASGFNLVVNGSFEKPSVPAGSFMDVSVGSTQLTGWRVVGSAGENVSIISGPLSQQDVIFNAEDGTQFLDLTGDGSNSTEGISQVLTRIVGHEYQVSFYIGTTSGGGGAFGTTSTVRGSFGDNAFSDENSTPDATGVNWAKFTHAFVANETSTPLTFQNGDPSTDNYNGLDNVVVTDLSAATINSIQPNSLDAGSAAFTLTVNGLNFVSTDTVKWNGVQLTTTYVSASKLTAKVPSAEVAQPGSAAVTVVDTAAGNAATEPALFTIPLTSIVINSQTIKAVSGGYSITLTLRNSGFKSAANISLTGAYLATSDTSTVLPVDIASIAAGGTKTVTLSFPSAAGEAGEEEYLLLYGAYVGSGISLNSIETLP